LKLLPN